MCIEKIKEFLFFREYKITPPVDTNDLDLVELYSILNSEFNNANINVTDRKYKTAPFSEYARLISWSKVDKRDYVTEYYDCDNFSLALMGEFNIPEWSALAFGILFAETPEGAHAINFFIDNNNDVWIVEPQNDSIFPMPITWKPYFVLI